MDNKILGSPRKYGFVLVGVGFVLVYFAIVLPFGYLANVNSTMFWSTDAQSYRSVADWILGGKETVDLLIRPFLYPFLLVIARSVAGSYGIWLFQFALWLLSGLILYRSLKRITRNYFLPVLGIILYAANVTLVLLTLHALTEVTTIFLLTILIAVIINKQYMDENHYWVVTIFILSLLGLLKPVFLPLWIILLIYRILVVIRTAVKQKLNWKYPGYIVIAILPVVIQLSIMRITFNEFTLSHVGEQALKSYFFARVYGDVNSISIEQARMDTVSFSHSEIYTYLFTHIGSTVQTYIKTLGNNFITYSNFINFPKPHPFLFTYMKILNILYFIIHVVMIPTTIIVFTMLYKNRDWAEVAKVLSLGLPLLVIFSASGITFWQGDRIILPGLPIWIVLYSLVISWIRANNKEKGLKMGMN